MNPFMSFLKALGQTLEPIAVETLNTTEQAAILELNAVVQKLVNKMTPAGGSAAPSGNSNAQ